MARGDGARGGGDTGGVLSAGEAVGWGVDFVGEREVVSYRVVRGEEEMRFVGKWGIEVSWEGRKVGDRSS